MKKPKTQENRAMSFLTRLLNADLYAKQQLGDAIARHDLKKMQHWLERGVNEVDYLQMAPGAFGDGKTLVPVEKFNNPIKLAEKMRLPAEGWVLMEKHGFKRTSAPDLGSGPKR